MFEFTHQGNGFADFPAICSPQVVKHITQRTQKQRQLFFSPQQEAPNQLHRTCVYFLSCWTQKHRFPFRISRLVWDFQCKASSLALGSEWKQNGFLMPQRCTFSPCRGTCQSNTRPTKRKPVLQKKTHNSLTLQAYLCVTPSNPPQTQ